MKFDLINTHLILKSMEYDDDIKNICYDPLCITNWTCRCDTVCKKYVHIKS